VRRTAVAQSAPIATDVRRIGRPEDERLDREPVDFAVGPADERADLAAGDPLDRLAELAHRGVLEAQPRLAQTLVLAEPNEVALGRGERVLQQDHQDIRTGPQCPGSSGRARTAACRDGHLTADYDAKSLRVSVSDQGIGLSPRGDSPGAGLGLALIATHADTLDIDSRPGAGTTVHHDLPALTNANAAGPC
jgi:hypothetical protein